MVKLLDPIAGSGRTASEVAGLRRDSSPVAPAANPEQEEARLKADFRVFLTLIWRYLGLSDPSPLQLSIAGYLQHGPARAVIEAFRGASKSWITAAFVLWRLYCDPQRRILVVSASQVRAVNFVQFCLALVKGVPQLRHLIPRPDQRQSSQAFDVGPAREDQSPSLRAAGISGQITGSRADDIVADDVEIPSNSATPLMREKIAKAVKEFDAILKPGDDKTIRYLGTPQVDASLYNVLQERDYSVRIWPVLYPTREQIKRYGDKLAPFIIKELAKNPGLAGRSVEPGRFTEADLEKRLKSYGRSDFALQFMLDTSLADQDRYPLKLRDLVVMSLDPMRGPDSITWTNDPDRRLGHLQTFSFPGDYLHAPAVLPETYSPYTGCVGFVDSSGRGSDETALSIVMELHGRVFLVYQGAWREGYSPATLRAIAKALVRFKVPTCLVESNFGDGMFASLLQPVVKDEWDKANRRNPNDTGGTSVEETKVGRVSKEARILSVLEPVTQSHRLVISTEVFEDDLKSLQAIDGDEIRQHYSLSYQITHLTREKNSLVHDDRLDSLAGAVAYFADVLGVSPQGMAESRSLERWEEEIEKLIGAGDDVCGHPRRNSNRPVAMRPRAR